MPDYPLVITSENPIPHDVLIEHIAVSLRDFNFTGKVDVRMAHPFDNPSNVVFDDDVQTEQYTGPNFSETERVFSMHEIREMGGVGKLENMQEVAKGARAEGGYLPEYFAPAPPSTGTAASEGFPLIASVTARLRERYARR